MEENRERPTEEQRSVIALESLRAEHSLRMAAMRRKYLELFSALEQKCEDFEQLQQKESETRRLLANLQSIHDEKSRRVDHIIMNEKRLQGLYMQEKSEGITLKREMAVQKEELKRIRVENRRLSQFLGASKRTAEHSSIDTKKLASRVAELESERADHMSKLYHAYDMNVRLKERIEYLETRFENDLLPASLRDREKITPSDDAVALAGEACVSKNAIEEKEPFPDIEKREMGEISEKNSKDLESLARATMASSKNRTISEREVQAIDLEVSEIAMSAESTMSNGKHRNAPSSFEDAKILPHEGRFWDTRRPIRR